jgi:hypothetical protein
MPLHDFTNTWRIWSTFFLHHFCYGIYGWAWHGTEHNGAFWVLWVRHRSRCHEHRPSHGCSKDGLYIAWSFLLLFIDIQHSHCYFIVMHSLHYHSKAMNYIILSITHPHLSPMKIKPHGEAHSTSMLLYDMKLSVSEEACLLLCKSELILFSASYGSWVSDVRSDWVACMKRVLTCMNTSEHDCNNGKKCVWRMRVCKSSMPYHLIKSLLTHTVQSSQTSL